jgi:hypothetical protein
MESLLAAPEFETPTTAAAAAAAAAAGYLRLAVHYLMQHSAQGPAG